MAYLACMLLRTSSLPAPLNSQLVEALYSTLADAHCTAFSAAVLSLSLRPLDFAYCACPLLRSSSLPAPLSPPLPAPMLPPLSRSPPPPVVPC